MKLHYNFISDFDPKFKNDVAESIDWLCLAVHCYEYKRAIKNNGYEKEDELFQSILDGFTVNFEIWQTNSNRPCKYNKDRNTILVNMAYFPFLSKKLMAGYIGHEISHEDDRFDHTSHQMTGFPYFTIYKIPKMSIKKPFFLVRWFHFLIDLFK